MSDFGEYLGLHHDPSRRVKEPFVKSLCLLQMDPLGGFQLFEISGVTFCFIATGE